MSKDEAMRRELRHLRRAHHELLLAADVAAMISLPYSDELAAAVLSAGVVVQLVDEELQRLREC